MNNHLQHFGVKGMRWGVRKKRTKKKKTTKISSGKSKAREILNKVGSNTLIALETVVTIFS